MSTEQKRANFALQGGGAHGAFTWGVLDKIFEDGRIDIAAISGTSAGAMNAVVCADGIMRSGKEGAREAMHSFWHKDERKRTCQPGTKTSHRRFHGKLEFGKIARIPFFRGSFPSLLTLSAKSNEHQSAEAGAGKNRRF